MSHGYQSDGQELAGVEKPHVSYKEYWFIFVMLTVLTALEVGIVYLPIARALMITGLIGMAVAKAALVLMFYMHLKHETRILQWTVIGPLLIPPFYAVVLMAEALWRMFG